MMNTNSNHLLERIDRLNRIGAALSIQQELHDLLEMILVGAKELTNSDAGSLYLLEGRTLKFELVHCTSLGIHMGGSSSEKVTAPSISLDNQDGTPNLTMVVTRAVIEERVINIQDAYENLDYDFSGTKEFDANFGYQSRSLLAIPMKDHENKIIGVLQLINATDTETGETVHFSSSDESLVASLASQAAIALTRKSLVDGLQELLQALVKLIAEAIDDKSPHTGSHCRRVPEITMALAEAVNQDTGPVFGSTCFDTEELQELEMAAWLHDCGKITTPEYIVDKQSKLETVFDRMHLVEARLNVLRREAEIAHLRNGSSENELQSSDIPPLDEELRRLAEYSDFLTRCNSGGEFFDSEKVARLQELAKYSGLLGEESLAKPLLTEDELHNLSLAKGTLTEEERRTINNHAQASINMLSALPFPKHLKNVPEIAGGHHERMDGKGYPAGVFAGELPVQARILAIADIFEALTASDRSYRKANKLSEALVIMARMCNEGHIDPELFDLLIRSRAYTDYARKQMKPEQCDTVDDLALRAIFQPALIASEERGRT